MSLDTSKSIRQVTYNGVEIPLSGGGGYDPSEYYNVTVDAKSCNRSNSSVVANALGEEHFPNGFSIYRSTVTLPMKTNFLAFHGGQGIGGGYALPLSPNPLNAALRIPGYGSSGALSHMQYALVLDDCTITIIASCLLPNTNITLADGSRKAIKDVTYNDELKVWDFDKGEFSTAPICWLTRSGLHNDHLYRLTFSDGTIVDFTGHKSNHKIYNVEERCFKGVNEVRVGDKIFSENGVVTITNKEYIEQDVEYYNLITTGTINCFCNGILAADRYGNMYPIDEDMKYIKGGRPIRPYSEFEPHHIKKYWYDNLRLGELTEDINDTINYIGKLECQMLPLPTNE